MILKNHQYFAIRYIWPPSFSSPHSLHLYQRAPSCGNNVRLALLLTGCRSQSSAQFLRGDQEPWAFRGGLAGEFQVSNAPNLQQSNGKKKKKKKSAVSKDDDGIMCVGLKGFGLSKVSWLQWVMLTTSRLHPLHLISKYVCALTLLWDTGSMCEGSGWPEFHPGRGKKQT